MQRGGCIVGRGQVVGTKVTAVPPIEVEVSTPVVVAMVLFAAVELESLIKIELAVAVNTEVPLKVVSVPMLLISVLMEVNSVFRAVCWAPLTVPVAASVAKVTARFNKVVTWDSARRLPAIARLHRSRFAATASGR